ncbi:2OG-FeII oxygenase superfamily protein [Catovirus CTV1]|uniref:2OG-FeII oxygenase superfamily protein n=1 Tax=Catovirus CTV1 TaxID=1977631 RepID=A0A1V0S983_9VIRU|nr:2OG-FeII oxygenase superfamily protein [Catovirus CTV1]
METYSDFIEYNEDKILDDYYYFDECFTNDELNEIDNIIKKQQQELEDGIILKSNDDKVDKTYRSSKIMWIVLNDETKWLYKKIGNLVNTANEEMWDFNILGMTEMLQYGEYHASEQGHYDWHMDLGGKIINRKISVTIQLSSPDEYEGGELQFMTSREIRNAPKGKGVTVIFPSYFLHRVTPVTKGVRKSLVIWITGKAFC